jgi:hypothetical protein
LADFLPKWFESTVQTHNIIIPHPPYHSNSNCKSKWESKDLPKFKSQWITLY